MSIKNMDFDETNDSLIEEIFEYYISMGEFNDLDDLHKLILGECVFTTLQTRVKDFLNFSSLNELKELRKK